MPPSKAPAPLHSGTVSGFEPSWDAGSYDAQDSVWEASLLEFLSELEQRIAGFGAKGVRDWPPAAVRLGVDTLKYTAAFTEGRLGGHPAAQKHGDEARAALVRAETAADTVAHSWGSKPGRFAGLFGANKGLTPEARESCFWVLRALPADMERYFLALGCGFASGRGAAKWVETYGVFLGHLKRVVAELEKS